MLGIVDQPRREVEGFSTLQRSTTEQHRLLVVKSASFENQNDGTCNSCFQPNYKIFPIDLFDQ